MARVKNNPVAAEGDKLSDRKEAIAKAGELRKDAPQSGEAEGEARAGGNIIDRSRHNYVVNKEVKTKGGRASVSNGDAVAKALMGLDTEAVVHLVKANGGEVNPKWDSLNPGLARMAAGNVLRKLARRSEGVTIGGQVIKLEAAPEKAAA